MVLTAEESEMEKTPFESLMRLVFYFNFEICFYILLKVHHCVEHTDFY